MIYADQNSSKNVRSAVDNYIDWQLWIIQVCIWPTETYFHLPTHTDAGHCPLPLKPCHHLAFWIPTHCHSFSLCSPDFKPPNVIQCQLFFMFWDLLYFTLCSGNSNLPVSSNLVSMSSCSYIMFIGNLSINSIVLPSSHTYVWPFLAWFFVSSCSKLILFLTPISNIIIK